MPVLARLLLLALLAAGPGAAQTPEDSSEALPDGLPVCAGVSEGTDPEEKRDLGRLAAVLRATLAGSPVAWTDLVPAAGAPDSAQTDFHRRAAALREASPALRHGAFEVLAADSAAGTLAFARTHGEERLVVMLNCSDEARRIRYEGQGPGDPLVPVFTSRGDLSAIPSLLVTLPESGGVRYSHEIPARAAVVFARIRPADVRPGGLQE